MILLHWSVMEDNSSEDDGSDCDFKDCSDNDDPNEFFRSILFFERQKFFLLKEPKHTPSQRITSNPTKLKPTQPDNHMSPRTQRRNDTTKKKKRYTSNI